MYDVSVVSCKTYKMETVRSAMESVLAPLGGLDWVREGMKVLIKPNLVSAHKPDTAVPTHPSLICALTRMLREKGAQVYVADSPGGPFNGALMERVYRMTGMKDAEAYGAQLNYTTTATLRKASGAKVAREMLVCDYLSDMDAVINVCKLKTHGMMGMSAAAKNLFGIVPGTVKPEYHFRFPDPMDFARMIVDLGEYVKPVLHICDAVVGMEGNGPTAGKARPIGVLLAASNPHKLDLVCANMIGCGMVPTLKAAVERGLTPENVEELRICGEYPVIPDWDIVRNFRSTVFASSKKGPIAWMKNKILPKLMTARPQVRKGECIGCGKCGEICPAKAIAMKATTGKLAPANKKGIVPEIDTKKCIRCFCCQEFCPVGAMKVKRPGIGRLLQRERAGRK